MFSSPRAADTKAAEAVLAANPHRANAQRFLDLTADTVPLGGIEILAPLDCDDLLPTVGKNNSARRIREREVERVGVPLPIAELARSSDVFVEKKPQLG